MGLEQKSVAEIVQDAVKGTYNVPEFQRGFVWRSDQVRDLLDSLYRDYPVGAMLVWDASEYEIARNAAGAKTAQWIVDGQQRATALCVAFGQKPYWWPDHASWNETLEKVDVLVNLDAGDGSVEFALTNPVRRRDPNWFSVRRAVRCETDDQLADLQETVAKERGVEPGSPRYTQTFSLVSRLNRIRGRIIPVITMRHELEDVAEIFGRVNQAGTRVTEADVTVALVAAANRGWVHDHFLPYTMSLADDGYDLDPGVFIRTITGIARGTARLKDVGSQFWKTEVAQVWPRVETAINHTVHLLQDRGVLSTDLLPSRNSLIPLFVFQERFGSQAHFDRAFRWFLLANADGRYSGSSATTLSQDLATIHTAATPDTALDELMSRLRVSATFEPTRFLEDYSRDRFGRLLLYLLLFKEGATDWVSKARIGFDTTSTTLNRGFLPEWHHIFPRAVLRSADRSPSDTDILANITVLNEATNRIKFRAKTPAKYIEEFKIAADELARHVVPADPTPSAQAYDDFIVQRAQRLSDAANAYFTKLAKQ